MSQGLLLNPTATIRDVVHRRRVRIPERTHTTATRQAGPRGLPVTPSNIGVLIDRGRTEGTSRPREGSSRDGCLCIRTSAARTSWGPGCMHGEYVVSIESGEVPPVAE